MSVDSRELHLLGRDAFEVRVRPTGTFNVLLWLAGINSQIRPSIAGFPLLLESKLRSDVPERCGRRRALKSYPWVVCAAAAGTSGGVSPHGDINLPTTLRNPLRQTHPPECLELHQASVPSRSIYNGGNRTASLVMIRPLRTSFRRLDSGAWSFDYSEAGLLLDFDESAVDFLSDALASLAGASCAFLSASAPFLYESLR